MKRGGPTRLGIGLLVAIIVIALIGGLIWVGRNFLGGNNQSTPETVNAGQKLLDKPTATTSLRLTVRGPITAEEEHYSLAITISQTSRNLTIWRGYDGTVMKKVDLANSADSFRDLAAAMNRAGLMREIDGPGDDNAGICAIGQLIEFQVLDGEKVAKTLWTTSCAGLKGDFAGLATNVIDLFLDQIPASRNLIDQAKNTLSQELNTANLNALR
jgi:hypothetical protein